MFSALKQNSILYILNKNNKLSLEIGHVINMTSPKFSPVAQNPYGMYVDIDIKVGEATKSFSNVPANLSKADFGNGYVIAEDVNAMIAEVEKTIESSRNILDAMPYHQSVLECGDAILRELSPKFAQDRNRDDKINGLETKMNNLEDSLCSIKDMLSKALNLNSVQQ